MNISNYRRPEESARGFDSKLRKQSFNNFALQDDDSQKNLLDNFREIIDKMDDKIQGNSLKNPNSILLNKNDINQRNMGAEKPVHGYN